MGVSEVLLCPYRCLEYKMESTLVPKDQMQTVGGQDIN